MAKDIRELKLPDYTYRATVDRVIDGDTIDVYIDVGFKTNVYKRLRFMNVDTEELRDSDPDRREKARHAKTFVQSVLSSSDQVYVQTVWDSTGKYGRLLAWVWYEVDGTFYNLNEELIKEGYEKER